jgi:hypothetical protein
MTIANGTAVTYAGSIAEYHGGAQVVASQPDHSALTSPNRSRDGMRYSLLVAGEMLTNVRRQSFTVPGEGETFQRVETAKPFADVPTEPISPADLYAMFDHGEACALALIGTQLPGGDDNPREAI